MKKKYISLLFAAGLMAFSTSCEDKLDIPQHGVLTYENYYKTDAEAETAATALYLELRSIEFNYFLDLNLFSDDFWAGGGGRNDNSDLEKLNEFSFDTESSYIQGLFETFYRIVYKANVILGHVPEEGATDVMQRVRAEAKVFRSFAYFYLTTLWGNPPFVDHELAASEYSRPNGTTEELWGLIEKDLTEAIASGKLPEKKSVNDKSTWRVTKQYAQAMLGKAYLWQKKYAQSAAVLDEVINSGKYKLYDGEYEDILQWDNADNCEVMLSSNRINDTNNPNDNISIYHIMIHWRTDKLNLSSDYSSLGWGFSVPQKSLYDDFVKEEGVNGYRLNQTMKTYAQIQDYGCSIKLGSSIINEGMFMWKWRRMASAIPNGQEFADLTEPQWMRYAEVLLLAAEANLEAGNKDKAANYLNQIRRRAKLADKTNITLGDVQIEKRLELCGEGTRFLDLLRWGLAADKLANQGATCPVLDSNGNVTYVKYNTDPSSYGFKKGKNELLPYPGAEMRVNDQIQQNPGW